MTYTKNILVSEGGALVPRTVPLTAEETAARQAWEAHQYDALSYEELVTRFIRERYSLDAELSLSRQRETKADEFEEYYAYCETCKARARAIKGA